MVEPIESEELKGEIIDNLSECISCKFCLEDCPLYVNWMTEGATGKMQSVLRYLQNGEKSEIIDEIVFSCAMCRACENTCEKFQKDVKVVSPLQKMRTYLIEEGNVPTEIQQAMEEAFTKGNPWGEPKNKRGEWASDLNLDHSQEKTLLFAGCTGSYDSRAIESLKAFVKLLKAIDFDFGYLGNDEPCCGGPILRMGETGLFEEMKSNFNDTIDVDSLETIVTPCPHGYHTLKNDYDFVNQDVDILHSLQFIKEHINIQEIPNLDFSVTYHDPCFLGRWNDIYDLPREILRGLTDNVVEMEDSRDESLCCGGGGGYIWYEDMDAENRPSVRRVEQAASTGADFLVTECPFCLSNFEDALKVTGMEDEIGLKSLSELVLETLQAK